MSTWNWWRFEKYIVVVKVLSDIYASTPYVRASFEHVGVVAITTELWNLVGMVAMSKDVYLLLLGLEWSFVTVFSVCFRFEKVRQKKIAAHKRQVLRAESSLNVMQREVLNLQETIRSEEIKLRSVQKELARLERTR
jgi:hypothetical protein